MWVGDVGGNNVARTRLTVLRVPFGRGERRVRPASYTLVLPGDPVDVETLMAQPGTGRLVLVTKDRPAGRFLVASRRLDPDGRNRLWRRGAALPMATDGAFFPDGRHVVVRSYTRAVFYAWPSLDVVGELELPSQPQGEGIAVRRDGRVFVSSEGEHTAVLRVRLPDRIADAVGAPRG